eukprot:7637165-Alexandrium_andersonii.AAC.1
MVAHGRSESDLRDRAANGQEVDHCESTGCSEGPGERGDPPRRRQGDRCSQSGARRLAAPAGEEHQLGVMVHGNHRAELARPTLERD